MDERRASLRDAETEAQAAGWTRDRFAAALGVRRETVWRWRTGASPVPSWVPVMLGAFLPQVRSARQV